MLRNTINLICSFLIFSPLIIVGQNHKFDSKTIEVSLKDSMLPKIVKEFYTVGFKISDDDKTSELTKIITEKEDHFFVLYFHTFDSLVRKSDGALSEILGKYCIKVIYNYPREVFDYFCQNDTVFKNYASLIGYEFYFKDEGTSDLNMNYSQFHDYLVQKLNLKNESINLVFRQFNDGIRKTMKAMR